MVENCAQIRKMNRGDGSLQGVRRLRRMRDIREERCGCAAGWTLGGAASGACPVGAELSVEAEDQVLERQLCQPGGRV